MNGWNELPKDILFVIFTLLTLDDLWLLKRACKRWKDAIEELPSKPHLWVLFRNPPFMSSWKKHASQRLFVNSMKNNTLQSIDVSPLKFEYDSIASKLFGSIECEYFIFSDGLGSTFVRFNRKKELDVKFKLEKCLIRKFYWMKQGVSCAVLFSHMTIDPTEYSLYVFELYPTFKFKLIPIRLFKDMRIKVFPDRIWVFKISIKEEYAPYLLHYESIWSDDKPTQIEELKFFSNAKDCILLPDAIFLSYWEGKIVELKLDNSSNGNTIWKEANRWNLGKQYLVIACLVKVGEGCLFLAQDVGNPSDAFFYFIGQEERFLVDLSCCTATEKAVYSFDGKQFIVEINGWTFGFSPNTVKRQLPTWLPARNTAIAWEDTWKDLVFSYRSLFVCEKIDSMGKRHPFFEKRIYSSKNFCISAYGFIYIECKELRIDSFSSK